MGVGHLGQVPGGIDDGEQLEGIAERGPWSWKCERSSHCGRGLVEFGYARQQWGDGVLELDYLRSSVGAFGTELDGSSGTQCLRGERMDI